MANHHRVVRRNSPPSPLPLGRTPPITAHMRSQWAKHVAGMVARDRGVGVRGIDPTATTGSATAMSPVMRRAPPTSSFQTSSGGSSRN
jgi:hypothetical protein